MADRCCIDYQLRQYGYIFQIDLGGKPSFLPGSRRWVDIGCFHDVVHVQYPPDPARAFTTDGLSQLGSVQTVILGYSSANDADVFNLAGLRELRYCDLTNTSVTDAGLERLAHLRNLKVLYVGQTGVSDAGCEHLEKMVNLYALGLQGTHIHRRGLGRLRRPRRFALSVPVGNEYHRRGPGVPVRHGQVAVARACRLPNHRQGIGSHRADVGTGNLGAGRLHDF